MNSEFKFKLLQHLSSKKENEGFTLIELLVVVIIIGVLAAIALPNLLGQVGKARESEAKNVVGALNRAQQAYFTERASFATNTDILEVPTGGEKYYTISITSGANSGQIQYASGTNNTRNGTRDYVGGVSYNANARTFRTVVCRATNKPNFSIGTPSAAVTNNGIIDASSATSVAVACATTGVEEIR